MMKTSESGDTSYLSYQVLLYISRQTLYIIIFQANNTTNYGNNI